MDDCGSAQENSPFHSILSGPVHWGLSSKVNVGSGEATWSYNRVHISYSHLISVASGSYKMWHQWMVLAAAMANSLYVLILFLYLEGWTLSWYMSWCVWEEFIK